MKRLLYMILSVVLACGLLTGCTVETQEGEKEGSSGYYFYYLDYEETQLKRQLYKPEEESAVFMLQDLVARLNARTLEGNNVNLLPKDVQIVSYNMEESVLVLGFNGEYSNMSLAREILVRTGLVKTFVQIPGITAVKFLVNGQEIKDTKGHAVGAMTAASFAEFAGSGREYYRYDTFTLYFTDKDGKKLIPEKRNLYYRRNIPRERVILELLAKGPMVKDHYPTISENAEVLSVMTADNVCYVDFDHVFRDYKLDVPAETVLYSVVNSLLAVSGAEKVQISINGEDEAMFDDEISLYNFFEWNEDIILEDN